MCVYVCLHVYVVTDKQEAGVDVCVDIGDKCLCGCASYFVFEHDSCTLVYLRCSLVLIYYGYHFCGGKTLHKNVDVFSA